MRVRGLIHPTPSLFFTPINRYLHPTYPYNKLLNTYTQPEPSVLGGLVEGGADGCVAATTAAAEEFPAVAKPQSHKQGGAMLGGQPPHSGFYSRFLPCSPKHPCNTFGVLTMLIELVKCHLPLKLRPERDPTHHQNYKPLPPSLCLPALAS